jgi:SAM-dependent methyltransferase
VRDVEAEVSSALERIRERRIDREFLSRELLDVVARERVSAFPWRGQFTPGLVGVLLDSYAQPGSVVLDPFAGSGTTLAEATRRGMTAIGTEVNPAALELARVFTLAELNPAERKRALDRAGQRLMSCIPRGADSPSGDLREEVADRYEECSSGYEANIVAVTMMLAMGDTRSLGADRLQDALSQVADVVTGLPPTVASCSVHLADARSLPIPDDSVDLIITSPPYINVFNYHQNYRPAIESLGWNVLSAAKTEIGANRKHRQNRFLTVVQYALDIMLAVREFRRVCRPGAHVIIVIGRESRVRGVAFANGEIVGCLAELLPGIDFVRWQERSFVNRFGEKIYEEVLTFKVAAADIIDPLPLAAETGRQILAAGRRQAASGEIASDIDEAIANSQLVRPSAEFAPVRTGRQPHSVVP